MIQHIALFVPIFDTKQQKLQNDKIYERVACLHYVFDELHDSIFGVPLFVKFAKLMKMFTKEYIRIMHGQ